MRKGGLLSGVTEIDDDWQLNRTQRDILVLLACDGPLTGSELHRALRDGESNTKGSTHRMVRRLARDTPFVNREPDPDDKRMYRNQLTAEGVGVVNRGVVQPAERICTEESDESE